MSIASHREGPFPNLDAYRGIGNLMVMTTHVAFAAGMRGKSEFLNRFLARLDIAIPIFFLVSGFLLFRPYASALYGDRGWPSTRDYFRNRALRILPVYWLAMITVMLWFGVPRIADAGPFSSHPFGGIAYYGLMLQTFTAQHFTNFDKFDQSWSIGTEVTFYAILPFLAMGWRRWAAGRDAAGVRRVLLTGCAVLWVIAQLWRTGMAGLNPSWAPSAAFWLPAHLDFFAVGMAMATWNAGTKAGLPLPRWIDRLAAAPGAAWAIALALWLVVVDVLGVISLFQIRSSPLDFSEEYVAKTLMYGIIGFFAVLPAVFGPQREGLIRRFLGSTPMVAIGLISLGSYLWHKAWLAQGELWTGAAPFQGSFIPLWLITVAGGLGSGLLCYWFVERPLMARKVRRSTLSRPDPVAA